MAMFGVLGYELNITELNSTELDKIRHQIPMYQEIEHLIYQGDLYRLLSPFENCSCAAASIVSKNKKEAIVWYWQLLGETNCSVPLLKLEGLDPKLKYSLDGDLSGSFYGDTLMSAGLRLPILDGDGTSIYIRLKAIE